MCDNFLIAYNIVAKLMYMLTTPANPESTTVSEQIAYLQSYKECILNSEVIAVFVVLLSDVLGVEPHLRAPDEVARCEVNRVVGGGGCVRSVDVHCCFLFFVFFFVVIIVVVAQSGCRTRPGAGARSCC